MPLFITSIQFVDHVLAYTFQPNKDEYIQDIHN